MNTPARPRPLRVLAAGAAIGVAVLAAGALIAIVTQAITGRASPLPTTPPWRWSLDAIAHWFSTDATSSSAVDVAVRVLAARRLARPRTSSPSTSCANSPTRPATASCGADPIRSPSPPAARRRQLGRVA